MKRLLARVLGHRPGVDLAGVTWYRLRYAEPTGPSRCLRLLARPDVAGRVLVYYRPDAIIHQLYLGVPAAVAALLAQLSADFGLSLQPAAAPIVPDLSFPTVAVPPWPAHCLAQLAGATWTCARLPGAERAHAPATEPAGSWCLPAPRPGVVNRPVWPESAPVPAALQPAPDGAFAWPLGHSPQGQPLATAGPVQLRGHRPARSDWLLAQLATVMAREPAGLVILDGAGDLAPRLRRLPLVARRLGGTLASVDVAGGVGRAAINPLAPLPGETAESQVRRWRRWFAGMDLPEPVLALLPAAAAARVMDLPALKAWLQARDRAPAVTSLTLAVAHLLATPLLARRAGAAPSLIEAFWSAPEQGTLLVRCPATGWARRQFLLALCLAAATWPDGRLIVHGVDWPAAATLPEDEPKNCVFSGETATSGPLTVWVQDVSAKSGPLREDEWLAENVSLLQSGESVIIGAGYVVPASWKSVSG